MANDKIHLRQGDKSDIPSTRTAGDLLFATYEDLIHTKSGDVTITQGDIYLDLSSGANGNRINLANDVDKARTLFAAETSSEGSGNWTAEIYGIDRLYDGLTIALRINSSFNSIYNALTIITSQGTELGPTLVWYKMDELLTNQLSGGAEILLTYRVHATEDEVFNIPPNGPIDSFTNKHAEDGWIVVGVTDKMHTLTLGGEYTYNGSNDISVPLGTIITLKKWSASAGE